MWSRLRAALSPQAMITLVAIFIAAWFGLNAKGTQESSLEERARRVLSSVHGAGEVHVVIATRDSQASSKLGIQNRQTEQIPYGAVAVAQGANDPWVQAQLTDALCALLGLPASAVSVICGGEMR